jgi:ABC-type nitrate/sulfonate/bicarbonate transport system ATPase subunit
MEVQGQSRRTSRKVAMELLDRFGLAGFERYYPSQLSGGMRQRVALLRTILCDKEILLLDEPFGALDALTRQRMHALLQDVCAEFRRTVLFITHDIDEAVLLSDRVFVLAGSRPTTIVAEVDVDLPRPRRRETVVEPAFVRTKKYLLDAVGE